MKLDASKLSAIVDAVEKLDARFDGEKYTVQAAEEWGMGTGPNGTGKRRKIKGYYVVSPRGRRVRAFDEHQEQKAQDWAKTMTEAMERGERWAMQ